MVIATNCSSKQTNEFIVVLNLSNYMVHCTSLETSNFNPIEVLEDFKTLSVQMVVLLLPRLIVHTLIEITARFHLKCFHYITVNLDPGFIRQVQNINPVLKFVNLKLFDSLSLHNFKNGSAMGR